MARKLVLFLGACALLQATSGAALHNNDNLGIVGGNEVSIKEAPFMAVLYKSYDGHVFEAYCGGSIIHARFVLTAAHCINGVSVNSRMVRIGSDLLSDGVRIDVEKVLCYDGNEKYTNNDVCLLKLRSPVSLGEKVALVQLPAKNSMVEEGIQVNVTGWGITSNNLDSPMSYKLRRATIPVVSGKKCSKTYPGTEANLFCAGSTGHDACLGDSGGPVTRNNVQVGIIKSGRRTLYEFLCGVSPGQYVRVAIYVDWINATILKNL